MAMAKVWATVFSCGLKGCLDHPSLLSQLTVGFRIKKLMSPAAECAPSSSAHDDLGACHTQYTSASAIGAKAAANYNQ